MNKPEITKLGALFKFDPDAAKKVILDSLERAKGNRTHAARALGLEPRTFLRMIQYMKLRQTVEERWPWPPRH